MTAQEIMRKAMSSLNNGTSSIATLDQLKVEGYNKTLGTLAVTDLDCPICLNKGNIAFLDDAGCFRLKECECMGKRRSLKRIRKSGLAEQLQRYGLDNFSAETRATVSVKSSAIDYLANGEGKWFVITGTAGTGKTHICTAICGELINAGKEVRYMRWRREAPSLKAMVNDRESYERIINEYENADVLYIDDLFKGSVTDADINLAFEILDGRYASRSKRTIISSEKSIEQLLSIDEAVGGRIYERGKAYCVKAPSESWRLK